MPEVVKGNVIPMATLRTTRRMTWLSPVEAVAHFWTAGAGRRLACGTTVLGLLCSNASAATRAEPSLREFDLADEYLIEHWGADEGLPSSLILSLAQTEDGYLWIGTANGLVRFDGVQFDAFHTRNTPVLTHNYAHSLHADRQGRLWIALPDRWIVFDQGRFITDPNLRGLPALAEEAQEGMLVHKDSKLFRWHPESWQQIPLPPNSDPVRLLSDMNRRVLLQTGAGWFLRQNCEWKPAPAAANIESEIQGILLRRAHGGFLGVAHDQVRLVNADWTSSAPRAVPWKGIGFYSIIEDRTGHLWLGSMDSGICLLAADGRYGRFSTRNKLQNDTVRSMLEDHEGNIWAGTEGGLYRIRSRSFQMIDRSTGLKREKTASICLGLDHTLWIGSKEAGVFQWNPQTGEVRERLAGAPILSVASDRQGRVWVGTEGYGLLCFEETEMRKIIPSGAAEKPAVFVHAILQDRENQIWFGGQHGLISLTSDGVFHEQGSRASPPIQRVRALAEDADGAIWIGTDGSGLFRYQENRFEHFAHSEGIAGLTIWALQPARDGTLWIGTADHGLWALRNGKWRRVAVQTPEPVHSICGLAEDDQGALWMSFGGGIIRLARDDLLAAFENPAWAVPARIFDRRDGLRTREVAGGSQPKICRTADGRLAFATTGGVALMDPSRLSLNTNPPPVVIQEVVADGTALPLPPATERLGEQAEIRVPPGWRRLEMRYAALSFAAPERVQFHYRLEGLVNEWLPVGNRRVAYFTRLPPGAYRFQVKAANGDGVWNHTGASLGILVLPHFWQTHWFRLLIGSGAAAALAGSVYTMSRHRHRRELERLQREQAVERERRRIARDLHDDLGSTLTKIAQQAYRGLAQPAESPAQLQAIRSTAHELVEALDEMVWAVNPRNDTLDHLVTYLCRFAEEYLRAAGVRCRLDVPTELPEARLTAETRHNLFLLFKEALNNVVRHARASECQIRVFLRAHNGEIAHNGKIAQAVEITIQDDGCGFDESRMDATGNGLRNMHQRLHEVGGVMQLEAAPGRGCRLTIRFPLGRP